MVMGSIVWQWWFFSGLEQFLEFIIFLWYAAFCDFCNIQGMFWIIIMLYQSLIKFFLCLGCPFIELGEPRLFLGGLRTLALVKLKAFGFPINGRVMIL